jgi:hypothetical protein
LGLSYDRLLMNEYTVTVHLLVTCSPSINLFENRNKSVLGRKAVSVQPHYRDESTRLYPHEASSHQSQKILQEERACNFVHDVCV